MTALLALFAAAAAVAPTADRAAALEAAGFTSTIGCDGREPLGVELGDFNKDGRGDALITDQGLACYGAAEVGFVLLSKSADGQWRRLHGSAGVPRFLATSSGGWPELEVGGPGFCFPVLRWNGREFVEARRAYQGKSCKR